MPGIISIMRIAPHSNPVAQVPPERRHHRRQTVRIASIVVTGGREIPCVVLNRSEGGFLLHVHAPDEIPESFKLVLASENNTYDCEKVWSNGANVGVRIADQHV